MDMIIGAHSIIYSKNAEADRDFLKDVLKLPHVDAGHGWLIFGLPPAEVAVHPSNKAVKNIRLFVREMDKHQIRCSPIQNQGWGQLTQLTLPGGGSIGVYQPRHARPRPVKSGRISSGRRHGTAVRRNA